MAQAVTPVSVHSFVGETPAKKTRGFFSRLIAAMSEARQRQAEREIALYLSRHGGKFTDDIERGIERKFLHQPTNW